jgi:hypothetical protein
MWRSNRPRRRRTIARFGRQKQAGQGLALRLLGIRLVQTLSKENSPKWPSRAQGGLKPLGRNTVYMDAAFKHAKENK